MHEDMLVDKFNVSLSWDDEKRIFIVDFAVHSLKLSEGDGLEKLDLKKLHIFFDLPVIGFHTHASL